MADVNGMPEAPALSATSEIPVVTPAEPANATPPAPEGGDAAAETPAAEGAASEEGAEGERQEAEPAAEQPGQKGRLGPRLSQLTAERNAERARADKYADLLAKAVETVERLQRPAEQPARPAEATPDPKPSRDQFADPDAYDEALIAWSSRVAAKETAAEVEKRLAAEREAETKRTQEEAEAKRQEETQRQWAERTTKLATNPEYADFEAVAYNPDLQIPMTAVPAILQAENGPEVLYHLGKNPEIAARIAGLDPLRQAIEVGRISAMLEQPARAQPRRLPEPIPSVGNRNANPRNPATDDVPMEEYAQYRAPKLQAERKASMWGRPTQPTH